MGRFDRLEVLNRIITTGLVPTFYNPDVETAKNIVRACAAAGAKVVEFTNRGDFAPDVFKELVLHFAAETPDVVLGVGSILEAPTAAIYIAYGAGFVVAPVFEEGVARLCNRRKTPYIPGCGSATEISHAEEFGVEIVKLFPGRVFGPGFVKAVLGPCPQTRIMPTSAMPVDAPDMAERDVKAWFEAGVCCMGMGPELILPGLVEAGNWEEITRRVRRVLGWIREARGGV